MYRILYIEKDTIYAISDEVVTKLKYGETSSFKSSYIYEWLNKVENKDNTGIFINNLENSDLYLKDKEVTLLDDPNLIKQMTMFEAKLTATGKVTYEAAKGYHDDIVMSVLLAFDCLSVGSYNIS